MTTKIMPDAYDHPLAAIKESNKTLGLGYIDLMLINSRETVIALFIGR